jgi:lysozyme
MLPSKDCYNLTEQSEGCRLKAYQDTGGVWTIGYGHTGGVKPNQVITQEVAEVLLEHDMNYAANFVNQHCLPCTQGQFDALTDFVFNVGPSQFLSSHLCSFHKEGEYDKAAAEFPKWKYDNGKVEPGLVARRAKEKELYTHQEPVEDRPHTDEQEHSVPSVADSASQGPAPNAVQSSEAPPAPVSQTVPVSGSGQSEFLSQALALIRKLLGKG